MKDSIEIVPERVYMTIPVDYICTYHKIIMYIADFGKDIINDCKATCNTKGRTINSCWNLFQSAVANYNIGNKKEAQFFIDYIEKQLDLMYQGVSNRSYPKSMPIKITPDGHLQAILTCNNGTHFVVDSETGRLYQEYLETNNSIPDENEYEIESNNLIYQINEI